MAWCESAYTFRREGSEAVRLTALCDMSWRWNGGQRNTASTERQTQKRLSVICIVATDRHLGRERAEEDN